MNSKPVDDWLKERKLSREWLADAIGKSFSTLLRILGSKEPSKTHLLAISKVTGIPVEELAPRTRARAKEPEKAEAG